MTANAGAIIPYFALDYLPVKNLDLIPASHWDQRIASRARAIRRRRALPALAFRSARLAAFTFSCELFVAYTTEEPKRCGVVISAGAGVGKSRLGREVLSELEHQGAMTEPRTVPIA